MKGPADNCSRPPIGQPIACFNRRRGKIPRGYIIIPSLCGQNKLKIYPFAFRGERVNVGEKLRVVCYNIHSGKDRWGRWRLDQMADLLEQLQADVIALQEVHQNSRYGYQADLLAERLHCTPIFAPAKQVSDGAYGNALLSRIPVLDSANMPLKTRGEPRSLLKNTLQYGRHLIDVWVTHCSLDRRSRGHQLRAIHREIRQHGARPLLIAGDFNTSTSPLSPLLQDCARESGTATATLVTIPRRIDYVYASAEWQVEHCRVIRQKISDHYPLFVTLTLSDS